MSSKLIIIRGPSGSGKSTIAEHLGGFINVSWLEADMYFMAKSYNWNYKNLGAAHKWCQQGVLRGLQIGRDDNPMFKNGVIVSNTSTTLAEVNTYIDIAKNCGVPYEIIRTPGPWNIDELFRRNKHFVPLAVIKKQIARYVVVKDEYEWTDLSIFNGVK